MRLARIELKDFRAFPSPETYTFDLADGKNLLLYGENGSGKSSLYRALVEFFRLDPDDTHPFYRSRNIFSGGGISSYFDGHVSLILTDGRRFKWECLGIRPQHSPTLEQTDREFIIDASYRKSFLEYRSLLRTNFASGDLPEQLFSLAVETLLANVPVALSGGRVRPVGEMWRSVNRSKPRRHIQRHLRAVEDAINDFNSGVQAILPDVERITSELLSYFADARVTLRLNLPGVRYNGAKRVVDRDVVDRKLNFEIRLNGEEIPEWNDFLNEARLSALALSIYLAGALLSNPSPPASVATPLKLLVLDDVLIGLDLSNRLPILRLLEERFSEYQVILLTYDKVWFEMAQLTLANPEQWVVYELYNGMVSKERFSFDVPVLRPQDGQLEHHFLGLADEHLRVRHDTRTAALHARAALEVKLKAYCNRYRVQVPYDLDGRQLNTDHFLQAIERRLTWTGSMPRALFPLQRVKLFRQGVLNPLVHFHPVTLATAEVQAAIRAVRQLEFPNLTTDFAREAADLLAQTTLTSQQLIDAACWLRTAFEVDVRMLLSRHGGQVPYRDDWTTLTLPQLWDAAKTTMQRVNLSAGGSLIGDIENHSRIFLDDWQFDRVSRLTKSDLESGWLALKHSNLAPLTRLRAFA
jgi:hypothetical protein